MVALVGIGGNPLPTITSTSPSSVYAGSVGFTLTLNGSGFVPSPVVSLNNTPRVTTFISSTQISFPVLASDLISPNNPFIFVSNPAPGGGFADWLSFFVIRPTPILNSLAPSTLVAGNAGFVLTISGGTFMQDAVILWNGSPRPTTFLNVGQLEAQISSTDVARAAMVQVSVANPAPGGGTSGSLPFNVTFPAIIRVLNLPANDLAWDPFARRIYASVPSSAGTQGNSIAVINPFTGTIDASHFAGSEPGKLALSDNGQFLYAGLNGAGSVQRLVLPCFQHHIEVSLGSNFFSANTAFDMKVVPGQPHTFAVPWALFPRMALPTQLSCPTVLTFPRLRAFNSPT
jgi:hypothetical protein